MAAKGLGLDQEAFCCSICLDLLKDPATIPCGHSYCMSCINTHWNGEVSKQSYSCPQCRQNFTQRPVLVKNTMLALLMEGLKKSGPPAAPVSHCSAAHGDVSCVKAVKSCLQCLVSYCKEHLQPHYDVAALKKHKLVEPTENLHDNICSRHAEVMKMFCRTDQQCICYLCSVDKHKDHDTVTAAAERKEKKEELEDFKVKILQRIDNKRTDKNVDDLQYRLNTINHSADKGTEYVDRSQKELTSLIEKRLSEVKKQIISQQQAEDHKVNELLDKLQQEITEMKRKLTEQDLFSHSDDALQFLHKSTPLSTVCAEPDKMELPFPSMVTAVVKEVIDKLEVIEHPAEARVTPANMLQYACDVTLNPRTAHNFIHLFSQNERARYVLRHQGYRQHPSRFTQQVQVLGNTALTGRCYIEMNLNYFSSITVCVTFRIHYYKTYLTVKTKGRVERVGIFLDHDAGLLAFYKLNEPKSLIHEIRTTFTQPLYLGN
ncbi:E3 ubiquitin/ISG15 ligase TRIM25-like [Eucyclogobius newberryi]|uniref:E3 ubiquitin/ISG15 ligase TRIM25-like n=1 Tax=Eucyclogobius newberryi TaxID=166745 RepID=UPI003B5C4910